MQTIPTQQLLESLRWRYAVKKFDPSRRIETKIWKQIEESLILTPSSFGLQPWKFVVIESPHIKAMLPAISWNQPQPGECSHMVVFTAMKTVSTEYIDQFLNQIAAVREVPVESLAPYRKMILGFMESSQGNHLAWSKNQAYIALGQLMASAAVLGIDACPMEGIVTSEYDQLLGISNTNFTAVVGCAMGYRHPDDKYASAAKVRFDAREVVIRL
jgi:nitroreductase